MEGDERGKGREGKGRGRKGEGRREGRGRDWAPF